MSGTFSQTSPGNGEFDVVAPYYDHLMRNVPYDRWVDYVEAILERRMARPRTVLDLCCGTGSVGVEMARRGYEGFGVDLAEPMVRRCGMRTPPLPAAVMDACRLGLRRSRFDLVVSLFDSLNYIVQPARLAQCLREVFGVLAPRGLLIFDLNTPRALSTGLFTQGNEGSSDKLLYSWKAHWDPRARLCRVDMTFLWRGEDGVREFHETHWQYAYEHHEVMQMLAAAGFTAVTPFSAYTFRPPGRRSDRIYYVARKE